MLLDKAFYDRRHLSHLALFSAAGKHLHPKNALCGFVLYALPDEQGLLRQLLRFCEPTRLRMLVGEGKRVKTLKAPRPASFNEADLSDKPNWLKNRPLLNDEQIAEIDERFRNRLRTLLAVDDLIKTLRDALEASGELANTFILNTPPARWSFMTCGLTLTN